MTQRGLYVVNSVRQLPLTDEDCPLETPERPCPFASCRFHLLVDQDARWVGNRRVDGLVLNPLAVAAVGHARCDEWSDDDVETAIDSLPESCSLDVALDGAVEQTRIAKLMGLGRTLVEKIEHESISKLKTKSGDQLATVGANRTKSRHRGADADWVLGDTGGRGSERQSSFRWGIVDDCPEVDCAVANEPGEK